jgi:hypothetical protein
VGHPPVKPNPPVRPPLLTELEVAILVHCDLGTLRRQRWMSRKSRRQVGPKWISLGRTIRYDLQDVLAYIDAHRVQVED